MSLISKPGISAGTASASVPREWSQSWFRNFISNMLKGADVRNATSPRGTILVGGNIATPYGQLDVSQSANLIVSSLSVGQGVQAANGVVNASGFQENGISIGTSTIATSGSISTTETYVNTPLAIPANSVFPSSTFLITAIGQITSSVSNLMNINVRFGPNGTTADTLLNGSLPINSIASNTSFLANIYVTFRSIGSSGSVYINVCFVGGSASTYNPINGGITTVNTSVANFLGMSFKTAAATTSCQFTQAIVQRLI